MFKKLVLLACIITSVSLLNSTQAQKTDIKKITGYWVSDSTSARLVFFFDNNKLLQLVAWDSSDGEEMEIVKLQLKDAQVETTERMKSTNYVTYNIYIMKDENTLINKIKGDGGTTIYFKRMK